MLQDARHQKIHCAAWWLDALAKILIDLLPDFFFFNMPEKLPDLVTHF